jgi:ABC-type amino acid transport substrate-binding protein
MSKTLLFVASVAASASLSYLVAAHTSNVSPQTAKTETTYERVLRTGEIRCAYAPYAPALIKDPNTGKLSGIFYDVMTEVGNRLNLRIHWVEEVGYGVIAEGFATDRYDAFCTTVWPTPERSRGAAFTVPLYYSPVDVFVRAEDHRFDNDLSKLDDASIIFSGRDGDISATYAHATFPKARLDGIPQLSDTSQTLDDVAHKKADATINEPGLLNDYLDKNPGSLVNITATHPISVSPNTIEIKPDQFQFKVMLDVTLQELLNNGFVDKTLRAYDTHNLFLRVGAPYQSPAAPVK